MGRPEKEKKEEESSQTDTLGNAEEATRDIGEGESVVSGKKKKEAEAIVRLITLATALHCGKAQPQGENEKEEEGETLLWTMVFFYTMAVVIVTALDQWMLRKLVWKNEERGPEQARTFAREERGPEQARTAEKEERGPEQARAFHDLPHQDQQPKVAAGKNVGSVLGTVAPGEEVKRPSFLPTLSVGVEVNIHEPSHQDHLRRREERHCEDRLLQHQGSQREEGKKNEKQSTEAETQTKNEKQSTEAEIPPKKENEKRPNTIALDNQPGSSMDFAHQQRKSPGFKVFTTKFGEVVHFSTQCSYVTRAETGPTKEARWCHECCRLSQENGQKPNKGESVKLEGRDVFHTNFLCPRFKYGCQFSVCKYCVKRF